MASHARFLAAIGAAALIVQPSLASAQSQPCMTEQEVSAIAIYSVPSLVQAVRLRCSGELVASGYLARRGDALAARYVALQPAVWPRAKSGLIKLFAGNASDTRGGRDTIAALKRAYRSLYRAGHTLDEAREELRRHTDATPELAPLVEFLAAPGRGIIR